MSTIAGIRFSKPLTELLQHAEQHGFRIEANGNKKGDLTVYPPDQSKQPVRISERGTNVAHIDNIRRSLLHAGMPDPRATDEPAGDLPNGEHPAVLDLGNGLRAKVVSRDLAALAAGADRFFFDITNPESVQRVMATIGTDASARMDFIDTCLQNMIAAIGLNAEDKMTAGHHLHITCLAAFSLSLHGQADAQAEQDAAAALRLAEEADHARQQAEKAAEKAHAKGAATAELLKAAEKRATDAEAEAARLSRVIEPLRALLNEQPA